LYLVAAIAILYAQAMAVQIAGLRQQVDPTGDAVSAISNWVALAQGMLHKGRELLAPIHFYLKIRNPALPPSRLSVISMSKFGSLASVP